MAKKPIHDFSVKTYPYVECREAHVWRHYDAAIDRKERLGYSIQKCANCETKRHRIISLRKPNFGQVLTRSYSYPKEYQIVGGLSAPERGQIVAYNFMEAFQAQQKEPAVV